MNSDFNVLTPEQLREELKKAYKKGYIDATRNLAVWNNGKQYVGVMRKELSHVIKNIENEFGYDEIYK